MSNALGEAHPMNGGDGPIATLKIPRPRFYAKKYCSRSKRVMEAAKEMIRNSRLWLFYRTQHIFYSTKHYRSCKSKFKSMKQKYPQFQVFFNDHVENDFNTLFRSLPSTRKYFATGVPGSFYAPLFPESSLHVIHLSYALHWLSRAPKDKSQSLGWNKESIYCTGKSKEVADAYFGQFKRDMDLLLDARAEENVSGELVCLIMSGLRDGVKISDTSTGFAYDLL
ncbi:SAM dependent carboxyl methyltransferase [Dillenia turbinata]|uniref:SAM dependent carboxyl methyltransferase n=1 Tax=Dillenia turbinata TaxID=194707 RepID=A0AAN8UIZ2_9MAGN